MKQIDEVNGSPPHGFVKRAYDAFGGVRANSRRSRRNSC
jgi:hypothetical protein